MAPELASRLDSTMMVQLGTRTVPVDGTRGGLGTMNESTELLGKLDSVQNSQR